MNSGNGTVVEGMEFSVTSGGERYVLRRDGADSYQAFRESDAGRAWCGVGTRNGNVLGFVPADVATVAPRLLGWT